MQPDETIQQSLAEELNIAHLPSEAQAEMLGKIGELALKEIAISALEQLPEEKRGEFDTLTQSGNPEKMQTFLAENIPNFNEMVNQAVKDTVAKFKQYAKDASEAK